MVFNKRRVLRVEEEKKRMFKLNLNHVTYPSIFGLRFVGLWPSEHNSVVYNVYGYVMFAVFSIILTLAMCMQMFAFGFVEKESLTDSMFMALTEIALIIKFVNFRARIHSMQHLMKQVKSFHIESDAERNQFNEKLTLMIIIWFIYLMGANTAVGSSHVKAYSSLENILIFPAYYGFDHSNGGINYWIIYAHQTIGMFLTSNSNVCIEMFQNLLMYMCSVEMDILGMRLRSLGYDSSIDDTNDERNVNAMIRDNKQGKTLDRLKRCIRLHKQIHALSIQISLCCVFFFFQFM